MATIEARLEGADEFKSRLAALGAEAQPAVIRALNRTMTTLRARGARALGAATGLGPTKIKAAMRLLDAKPGHLDARLRISDRPLPLITFVPGARPGQPVDVPVSMRVRPSLPTTAFAQRMPLSGHRGIFKRTGRFGRRGNPHLEKITELFGASLAELAIERGVLVRLQQEGVPELEQNLEHELAFRLSRLGGA